MGRIAGVTADETRERLVDAAARVFADNGYEGTRVSDVAREAGLTTGAIYAHYRNKADLLADAIRCHSHRELTALLSADGPGSTLALFESIGNDLIRRRDDAERTKALLLLEAVLAMRRDPQVAALLHERVSEEEALMTGGIRQTQDAGLVDAALDPEALARFCLTLALGSLVIHAIDLEPADRDTWADVIHRVVESVRTTGGER